MFKKNTAFNAAVRAAARTRESEAAKYFTSESFLDKARNHFKQQVIEGGHSAVCFRTDIAAKPHDQPHLDVALLTLKAEFPEINHLRVTEDAVTVDTKPNTKLRRFTPGIICGTAIL